MNNCISKFTKILLRIAPLTFMVVLLFSACNSDPQTIKIGTCKPSLKPQTLALF
jgi:hypothetical protein